MARYARFMLRLGGAVGDVGEIKWGFKAPADAYDNIGDELGITKMDGEGGLTESDRRSVVFGANQPYPPRVRINYKVYRNALQGATGGAAGGDDYEIKGAIRFCDPDKLGQVLNGSINDKKIKVGSTEYDIESVSTPRS